MLLVPTFMKTGQTFWLFRHISDIGLWNQQPSMFILPPAVCVKPLVLLTWWEVISLHKPPKIQQIFLNSYEDFRSSVSHMSGVQEKAATAILNCKSGSLGCNISQCTDCGHMEFHNNSCRNRNCPNCQAILKEIWIDKRRAEVIDSPYFHVVFTVPHELNPLIYGNKELLYSLLHRCSS